MSMSNLGKSLGIGAIVLALSGCAKTPPPQPQHRYGYTSGQTTSSSQTSPNESSIYGTITDVQPGNLAYYFFTGSGHSQDSRSVNHQFEYVVVNDQQGKSHVLLYPFSKGIPKGQATISYRPLNQGITVNQFVDDFINPCLDADENFLIEAEGIILPNGIAYESFQTNR